MLAAGALKRVNFNPTLQVLKQPHDPETSGLASRMLSWFDRSPSFSRSDHLVRFWIVSKVHAHSPFSLRCTTYRYSGQRQRSLVFVLIALDDADARGDVTGGEDVCLGKQKDRKGVCPPGTYVPVARRGVAYLFSQQFWKSGIVTSSKTLIRSAATWRFAVPHK